MRHAVVDTKTGLVKNVVEIANGDGSKPDVGQVFVPTDTAGIDYTYATGIFTAPPPPPPPPQTWADRRTQAQAALENSDIVAIRCFKSGIPYPASWLAYDIANRAIVSAATGDATVAAPVQPPLPNYS